MSVRVTVDADTLLKLSATVLRQLPFAMNQAINRTAKLAVEAGRLEVETHFTIRKAWILNRVRVLQYSNTGTLTAVVGIDPRVQGAPLLLGFFEEGEGGVKEPIHGPELAVPLTGGPARPSFPDPVQTQFRYTNLQFTERKGRKKTFIIPGVGIFERVKPQEHRGDDSIVMVYAFKPSVPLRTRMEIRRVMEEMIRLRFGQIFAEEFRNDILTAHI